MRLTILILATLALSFGCSPTCEERETGDTASAEDDGDGCWMNCAGPNHDICSTGFHCEKGVCLPDKEQPK